MPLDEKILGFSNRWYAATMETALSLRLEPGLEIRLVTAPYFIATKLEAFKGRGNGDYSGSHDLEDLISVIDGRPTLANEIRKESIELRTYIAKEVKNLLQAPRFIDALPGHLLPDAASQARMGVLVRRLEQLTEADKRLKVFRTDGPIKG